MDSNRARQPEVTELIAKLPRCSSLRDQLERGQFGDGVEKSHMRLMAEHGVQRAYFGLRGKWRHGRPDEIRIVKRLYYKKLDGPDAQITDQSKLEEIEKSGLAAMLDDVVRTRTRDAHLYAGVDRWAGPGIISFWLWQLKGGHIYGSFDLFSSGWLNPSRPDLVFPGKPREDLMHSADLGDVTSLTGLLNNNHYSQLELDEALRFAVMSSWDNTTAIDLLLKAGANVNSRLNDGTTPLMLAEESPCNASALLARGARLDDRDNSGHTALELARQRHNAALLRVLAGVN